MSKKFDFFMKYCGYHIAIQMCMLSVTKIALLKNCTHRER